MGGDRVTQPTFLTEATREGTREDVETLKTTYKRIGFDVLVWNNLTADKLEEVVDSIVQPKRVGINIEVNGDDGKPKTETFLLDYKNYASLTLVALSHGHEGFFYASDWQEVNINRLKLKFNSNSCPGLYDKPKIFIIQACQGAMEQSEARGIGLEEMKLNPADPAQETENLRAQLDAIKTWTKTTEGALIGLRELPRFVIDSEVKDVLKDIHDRIAKTLKQIRYSECPPIMDFVTIRPHPGFKAYRLFDDKRIPIGSTFIQNFCHCLNKALTKDNSKANLEDFVKEMHGLINADLYSPGYFQTVQSELAGLRKRVIFEQVDELANVHDAKRLKLLESSVKTKDDFERKYFN